MRKRNEYMTELDKLGLRMAAREKLEIQLGLRQPARWIGRYTAALESLDDLVKRDEQRELDGFGKKIKFRRVLAGPGKVISVPYVEEERLSHDAFEPKHLVALGQFLDDDEKENGDITQSPGSGKGEVGDVIDKLPLPLGGGDGGDDGDGDDGNGPGAGDEPGDHSEEEAYAFGKRLTEKLELPNLTEKKKRFPTDEYTYDLTDRHDESGQVLDEEETLARIIETNLVLGRIDKNKIDSTRLIVAPEDEVYRVLSRERIWKSQAMVFFLRDYSGSMWGEPTEALVSQHLMIYAWLLVQYERRVIPRFFIHDTVAREVTPRQYFGLVAGGGTLIVSGYKKINETVEGEGLASEYDIFLFQGTDGDDGDQRGIQAVPEMEKIFGYVSRMGVTLFKHPYYQAQGMETSFEEYVEAAGFLDRRDVFRMHVMSSQDVSEEMNLDALKALIAQD